MPKKKAKTKTKIKPKARIKKKAKTKIKAKTRTKANGKRNFSKIYSFSKLERFKKCPFDYYLYYLDPKWKGFQKPRDYKTKGSAVHGAITLFYHLPKKKRTFNTLKDCLKQAWFLDSEPERKPPLGEAGGFFSLNNERRAYVESLRMLRNLFNLEDTNPSLFYVPGEDIKHSFPDYEEMIQPISKNVFISGKFDRIDKLKDGTLRIIDFKTGKRKNGKSQLDFYTVLAGLNFEIPVGLASFYYLASGEIVDFPASDSNTKETKEKILEQIGKIEGTKDFPARPSRLCSYCDFYDICPHVRKN